MPALVVRCATNRSFGSVAAATVGMVVPPASGISAMRPCCFPPIVVVSLPTHSPWPVAKSAWAPTPRVRPGFHDSGRPLTGSRAAMPVAGTAPGPAWSPWNGLFCQRMWPPT